MRITSELLAALLQTSHEDVKQTLVVSIFGAVDIYGNGCVLEVSEENVLCMINHCDDPTHKEALFILATAGKLTLKVHLRHIGQRLEKDVYYDTVARMQAYCDTKDIKVPEVDGEHYFPATLIEQESL